MTAAGGEGRPGIPPADEVIENATEVQPVPGRSPVESTKIKAESQRVDLRLQKFVGYGASGLMFAQVVVANLVFLKYADSKGWSDVPTGVMQAWLIATVVQVIGVVLVIARSVFPAGGR